MKEEYKYIDSKVVAYDDKKGLQVYEYQDNIGELLNQENIIETINNILKELNNEKKGIKIDSNSFRDMLYTPQYGSNVRIMWSLAVLIVLFGMLVKTVAIPCAILGLISMISVIPTALYQHKKYKKDMLTKTENLEQQISEFEKILIIEECKLNNLKNNKEKTNEKNVNKESVEIDNTRNKTINIIENKKRLYKYFRENLNQIKKYKNKGLLRNILDSDYTDDDIEYIDSMYEKNKVLKKHN